MLHRLLSLRLMLRLRLTLCLVLLVCWFLGLRMRLGGWPLLLRGTWFALLPGWLLVLGGLRLLMFLRLWRFLVFLAFLLVLRIGRSHGCQKEGQKCRGDNASSFHL
jgi:hypothetical protein